MNSCIFYNIFSTELEARDGDLHVTIGLRGTYCKIYNFLAPAKCIPLLL